MKVNQKTTFALEVLDQDGVAFAPDDPIIAGGAFTATDSVDATIAQESDPTKWDVTPSAKGDQVITFGWKKGDISLEVDVPENVEAADRVPTTVRATELPAS